MIEPGDVIQPFDGCEAQVMRKFGEWETLTADEAGNVTIPEKIRGFRICYTAAKAGQFTLGYTQIKGY